jgi:hypothetical protein
MARQGKLTLPGTHMTGEAVQPQAGRRIIKAQIAAA